MLKKIFYYLVPYPLMEKFVFSNRVVTSWIFLGSVIYILMILSTPGIPLYEGFIYVLTTVIAYCFLGLLGLAIDKKRGKDWEYNGLYWWFYPIISMFYISFSLNMIICSIVGFFMGERSPDPTPHEEITSDHIGDMNVEDFMGKFGKEIENAESNDQLDENHKKIIKKIKGLDRGKLRRCLSKQELEMLFILLLSIISKRAR